MLVDNKQARTFVEIAEHRIQSYLKSGKFVLILNERHNIDAFDSCLLNLGLIVFAQGYGACVAARELCRQKSQIVTASEIAARAQAKENRQSTFKTVLGQNTAWILSSIQYHKTAANFASLDTFLGDCYVDGVNQFLAENAG